MKRYLLFWGLDYYPSGGWSDFNGAFDTLEEAMVAWDTRKGYRKYQWYQVVDTTQMEVCSEGGSSD